MGSLRIRKALLMSLFLPLNWNGVRTLSHIHQIAPALPIMSEIAVRVRLDATLLDTMPTGLMSALMPAANKEIIHDWKHLVERTAR